MSLIARIWGTLFFATMMASCGSVEYRRHLFSELHLEVRPGLELRLSAFGSWHSLPPDSGRIEVNGSPYTIDLRIRGPTQVGAGHLTFIDISSRDSVRVAEWDNRVQRGALTLIVSRFGTVLPARDQRVEGQLFVGSGEAVDSVTFSGTLIYEYRVEHRNRLLEALRGI